MTFADLTWEDLKDWAGERVVGRGKSYKSEVEDLRITAGGALLAWVYGSDRYATLASMSAAGELSSQCTCPYSWGPCKHAVAVILAYLDMEKNKRKPPVADRDDERFAELAEIGDGLDSDEGGYALRDASPEDKGNELVRAHLEGLPKRELVNLILEGRDVIPELRRQLSNRANVKKGNISKFIASVRRDIDRASSEPSWSNHWSGGGHIPDYAPVKGRMEDLLSEGQADAVVELGEYLMKRGIRQIERSDDDGETGMEIADCMAVVFKAVTHSSLSTPQRLLWEIDLRIADNYSLLDGLQGPLGSGGAGSREDWNRVADALSARLDAMSERKAGERYDYSSIRYDREQVMRWLLTALERASRHEEAIPLLERETAQTDCYVDLVKKLIESGQAEKAREWARKGFARTLKNLPGIAWQLVEELRGLAVREKNYPMAAAYRSMEFFNSPGLLYYSGLRKAAQKAGVWDNVRRLILAYLETGRRPDVAPGSATQSRKRRGKGVKIPIEEVSSPVSWPLPQPELPVPQKELRYTRFPDTATLIDIALDERRHDDALRWYRHKRGPGFYIVDDRGAEVAQAVRESHPDDAVAIWKELVSREIARVKLAAYREAGAYLKKIKAVFERTQRMSEWSSYLSDLRAQNVRRPRMLNVLNSLEDRRTPIVR